MSSEKSLTPQIRFKGFTEAWEQRKLGDLSKILGGFAWSSKEYTPRGEFLVITISNVTGDYFIDDSIGNRINLEKESNYILASGDILVSLTGNVGRVSKMGPSKGVLNQRVAKMIPSKKIEIEFLFQLMRDTKFELKMIESGQGAAQKNISNNNILSYSTNIPNISEQKRIGHTLKKIDSLITLHQRKLDALKKIKSALLEKMFPKDGSNIPEIRFAGYTEAWEQHKLGDYGFVQMCRRIYKDQTSEVGDVPFFKIGTFGSQPDAFISRSLFQDYRKQYPFPSVGTTLISAAGSIGRTIIYRGEEAYFQDSNIVWLDNNEKLNNVFLNSLYKKIDWKLEGSTIKRLYNKDILNAEVCVPSTIEQCQVGSFFARLDSLITLHQRKLDALKKIKSALLEKMFV